MTNAEFGVPEAQNRESFDSLMEQAEKGKLTSGSLSYAIETSHDITTTALLDQIDPFRWSKIPHAKSQPWSQNALMDRVLYADTEEELANTEYKLNQREAQFREYLSDLKNPRPNVIPLMDMIENSNKLDKLAITSTTRN